MGAVESAKVLSSCNAAIARSSGSRGRVARVTCGAPVESRTKKAISEAVCRRSSAEKALSMGSAATRTP